LLLLLLLLLLLVVVVVVGLVAAAAAAAVCLYMSVGILSNVRRIKEECSVEFDVLTQ
jgi:hypothetical protein